MAETMQVSAQRAWTHLKKYQPLIHELVSRDLKVKYRRSFLGYIWSILNPLLMMLLQSIIFSYMFRNLMMYGNIPGPNTWIACIFCAVASMAIGLLVFRKLQKNFILYI